MKKTVIVLMFVFWRVALWGASLNNSSNGGFLAANFNNTSGNVNANIRGHLSLKPKNIYPHFTITLALAKKNKITNGISSEKRKFCFIQANISNMKRFGNLYDQIISKENIFLAFKNARKGKKNYKEVIAIASNPELYLSKLHETLKNEQFVNSKYFIFKRNSGHKIREIYKLPFYPDRLVHHCIVQIMQPIWVNSFITNTFSTIPGRGIHAGVKKVKQSLKDRKNTQYCLKMDVAKYYPSVDHDILKSILGKQIKDKRLCELLGIIIDSAPGIPIGNYISQWFGNIYMSGLDHYIKESLRVKHYFRYADDMVLLSDSKTELWRWKDEVNNYLNNELHLKMKENYQIFPVDVRGIDFLGYKFFHTHTLIRKGILSNFKKSIKNKQATRQTQSAYWGWFKYANTYNLTQKYFKL